MGVKIGREVCTHLYSHSEAFFAFLKIFIMQPQTHKVWMSQ